MQTCRHLLNVPSSVLHSSSSLTIPAIADVWTVFHDCNCDTLQLTEWLAGAANTADIYNQHPMWKQQCHQILYSRSEGADHVNPKYFTNDLIVTNIALATVWKSGRIVASEALEAAGLHCDF
jgi:hypothetical protein